MKIEEASYEGNNQLIHEWIRQLGLQSVEDRMKTSEKRIIFFIGDRLTVSWFSGLQKMRAEDLNSFDRYDFLVPVCGWLHANMAHVNSLHEQYLGSNADRGIRHAATLLKRKGLLCALTKGPFYHNLKELVFQVTAAHVRVCWRLVSGVEKLESLRRKRPEELIELAEQLLNQYASSRALSKIDEQKKDEQYDEVMYEATMMTRDLLHYVLMENAVKHGDVGIMENMLTHLYLYTSGFKEGIIRITPFLCLKCFKEFTGNGLLK